MKNTKQTKKPVAARKAHARKKRPLYRRISLHPVSIMILLSVGVLMAGSTFIAIGASSTLSMRITDTPLTEPAQITDPSEQSRFGNPDISIQGTCPNNSYVKIYKNNVFNGVASCNAGKFAVAITLSAGANLLSAKAYNFSDQEGPGSTSITVYYDPPAPTAPTPPQAGQPSSITSKSRLDNPLRIITDYKYKVFKSGQPLFLDLALAGGTAPYAVAVNWNDDTTTPVARLDTSPFQVEHIYPKKPHLSTYVIKVAASDLNGNTDYIQLMAVVDGEEAAATPGSGSTSSQEDNTTGQLQTWLVYLWPAYLTVVLMVFCFYLGEREEYRILMRKKTLHSIVNKS